MHTTNYHDTLITTSPDCARADGAVPDKPGSIAALQYALLAEAPYAHTSDDVLFAVFASRKGLTGDMLAPARTEFFSRPQACLRASPLVKAYGWSLHHDAEGRVALVLPGSPRHGALMDDTAITKRPGMRSKRA